VAAIAAIDKQAKRTDRYMERSSLTPVNHRQYSPKRVDLVGVDFSNAE
jgi:hypothetical protein